MRWTLASRGAAESRYSSNSVLRGPDSGGFPAPPSNPKTPGAIGTGCTNERSDCIGASSVHAVGFARSRPNTLFELLLPPIQPPKAQIALAEGP